MAVICKKCGGPHPVWDCTATPAKIAAYESAKAVKPAPSPRMAERASESRKDRGVQAKKSTAARKDVHRSSSADSSADSRSNAEEPTDADMHPQETANLDEPAGTQAPPVDILAKAELAAAHLAPAKRGRPRLHPDRAAYKAQKERERRARLKTAPK